ncbi:glutamate receptor ionotropic, NMDA 1 isoform X1 [Octopus bimaculoides]|uniref:glutamate receptor ionotropic, NMDA 1 isoform X1 n=1 Tax=Octopus bimaculoides TaxID=37653 RepID=UPI00071C4F22|nr:glutamate receptor ionotropic, NMDA 1 isoform X1 [Octopus bimaculoides]|eukprot:XP_014790759.1 PREDICTED: glutamate receptor ionotropic, NMDA 1-like isoform X1 [Octopus bimaculoides]
MAIHRTAGIFWLFYLTLFTITALSLESTQPIDVYTIGGVLSSREHQQIFDEAIEHVNQKSSKSNIIFNSTSILMNANPIRSALSICEDLIPNRVYVVIASHPYDSDQSPISVSYTCGFYNIPVIGISSRESVYSDNNVHNSFIRTVPPYFHQAEIWIKILQSFKWTQVMFIYSRDEDGQAILSHFQTLAKAEGISIEKTIRIFPGVENYTDSLVSLKALQSRVILLYALKEDSERIFTDAGDLELTSTGYAWLVTEQSLQASNIPVGTLGTQLINGTNEAAHIQDSISLISQAFIRLRKEMNISEALSQCNEMNMPWYEGKTILQYLKTGYLEDGVTGQVSFNLDGDRKNPVYNIMNVQQTRTVAVGIYGSIKKPQPGENPLAMAENINIVWPGNTHKQPEGLRKTTHLKVVTIQEEPFIKKRPIPKGEACDSEEVFCPHTDKSTGNLTEYCCKGYCIDLLKNLSTRVNFTFELHLSSENTYGSFERRNGSSDKKWNGMIGEMVSGEADMIMAPLTINPERAQHIDFSKPFKYQGLTILVKKTRKDSSLASFLQPFQDTLWILVGLSVHVVALVLYLLDRFSPFGRFKLAKSDDTEEDALNLSSAMWFAWGVLLNSGIGEGTPRSFSARVLGMVWAGFAMIIVASYTANLAAFLVLDRPEASISGIDDPRLRNPQENFKYATVKKSAVEMYFKRQVELSTMYRTMETRNYNTAEEAIDDVRKGKLQAFIWDSSRLEFEAANDCELVTAGELFGRSGYGIGLRKHSPWTQEISLSILSFHESGFMEDLDSKWILVESHNCPERDSSPATLGLTNMAGVFMMVAGGIVAGVLLIFVEILYKRHRGMKEKELELARNAADRWRGNIEKRKTLRQSWRQMKDLKTLNMAPSDDANVKRRTLRQTLQKQREAEQKLSQFSKMTPITTPTSMNPTALSVGTPAGVIVGGMSQTHPTPPKPAVLLQRGNSQTCGAPYPSDAETMGNVTGSSRPVTPGPEASVPTYPMVTDGTYANPAHLDDIL